MASMSTKGACLACRVRKVKCILGPAHRCERCTTLGLEDCVYERIKKRGVGRTLRMGEACKRCRARKRKCDAKRPCTTCVDANSECEHEIVGTPLGPPEHLLFLRWNEPDQLRPALVPAHRRLAVRDVISELPPNIPLVATITQSRVEIVPPAHALIRSLACNSQALPYVAPAPRPHTPNHNRTQNLPSVELPPFSAISSLIFPKISPESHFALSFLRPERVQLSDAVLGDLNMKFRLRVLCRLNKLGIRFTSEKQQAMLRGDTSGTVIHPFFIYGAQSLGMYFCDDMDNSPAMARLQAKHNRMAAECLEDIFRIHDWELKALAGVWVLASSIVLRLSDAINFYIQRGCGAINTGKIQFVPTYGQPPEFSEDLHEKISVLSQIIYFENFSFLTCGGAEPTISVRIEKEFRHDLPKVYPVLFKICPLTMRTQTILLVRDTVFVLGLRPTEEDRLGIWKKSCNQLVPLLDDHSRTLLLNLQRFQELGDTNGAGIIRSTCVDCLAHLAVLCEAIGGVGPAPQTALEALCDSTLERLSELARDTCMEECTRLDLLLGISWERALGVFDARLVNVNVPHEHGVKLRHWRELVAEVHSDFAAKFPDAVLPTLVTQAKSWEGGWPEGLGNPSLMSPGVMSQYGS